jgi:hypothetical protein
MYVISLTLSILPSSIYKVVPNLPSLPSPEGGVGVVPIWGLFFFIVYYYFSWVSLIGRGGPTTWSLFLFLVTGVPSLVTGLSLSSYWVIPVSSDLSLPEVLLCSSYLLSPVTGLPIVKGA